METRFEFEDFLNLYTALILLGGSTIAHATIVGLNQIVTPEIQPTGVLAFSAQAQHATIGNSQELQLELGLTPRFEVAWFQGLTPGEGLFSTEFNLLHQGLNLLTIAAINWSTRGGRPQPVIEYGYYLPADNFVAGAINVDHHAELLLGYKHVVSDKLQLSADFKAGAANATTVGFTWALTPSLSVNPALYRINSGPHHLLGYLVVTWNIPLWR
jgi:hypothetical protein